MPSLLDQALGSLGVTNDANGAIGATLGLTRALDLWNENNLGLPTTGPGKVLTDAINAAIPPQFRNNPNPQGLQFKGKGGEWTALHYADDLVAHHPKFKFIFKVNFEGFEAFGNPHFYYYVHRCDKPNVTFNHTDVNYYNFRTKVLTSTVFQPLTITFLDEIGNSVNDFFVKYISSVSGQAGGKWGTDTGFGASSGTKPYKRGYSNGKAIVINQIFANGLYRNKFKFINPRIESFQFDELNMEDNAGSLVTMQFHYDALVSETHNVGEDNDVLYTWGNTDILKGGGSSGLPNAGRTSMTEDGKQQATSANGGAQIKGNGLQKYVGGAFAAASARVSKLRDALPNSLKDLIPQTDALTARKIGVIGSGETTLSRGISETLSSIRSGLNFSTEKLSLATALGPLPSAADFEILTPQPTGDDASYSTYLSGVAADLYANGGSVPVVGPDGITVLGPASGPYYKSAYLSLPSRDSSAVAGPSTALYNQPLTVAEIALRAGVTFKGPSKTTVGP